MGRKYKVSETAHEQTKVTDLNFAAVEAYKRLRTNIIFAMSEAEGCCVVGITSSVPGEGKSTLVMNLAKTMTEDGKKVLLIEADMRAPVFGDRLRIRHTPGLSDLLAGMAEADAILQESSFMPDVIMMTAGTMPPNPSELLGSVRMQQFLNKVKTDFDYILLDLPPVGAVTDALVVSRLMDGILVVAREGYTHKPQLTDTMRQLACAKARVIGMVLTDDRTVLKKRYGKYGGHYGLSG